MCCQCNDLIQTKCLIVLITVVILCCITKCVHAAEYNETDICKLATPYVGEEEAAVCSAVCYELGELEDIDPLVIADVWMYEVGFQKYPEGYYVGGLQLSPDHLDHFSEYGLSVDYWKHWIWYGVKLWRRSADKGRSLNQALRPWGVRNKVLKRYKAQRGSCDGWDAFSSCQSVEGGA